MIPQGTANRGECPSHVNAMYLRIQLHAVHRTIGIRAPLIGNAGRSIYASQVITEKIIYVPEFSSNEKAIGTIQRHAAHLTVRIGHPVSVKRSIVLQMHKVAHLHAIHNGKISAHELATAPVT